MSTHNFTNFKKPSTSFSRQEGPKILIAGARVEAPVGRLVWPFSVKSKVGSLHSGDSGPALKSVVDSVVAVGAPVRTVLPVGLPGADFTS